MTKEELAFGVVALVSLVAIVAIVFGRSFFGTIQRGEVTIKTGAANEAPNQPK